MRSCFVGTRHGAVVFSANPETLRSRAPLVLLFHGAFRAPDDMLALGSRFPQVAYASLPGHRGAPELSSPTLAAWIEAFSEAVPIAFPRPVLAVGESLGGLVTTGLRGVVGRLAIDPFIRCAHIWPVAEAVGRARRDGRHDGAASILANGSDFSWVLPPPGPLAVLAGEHDSLLDTEAEASFRAVGDVARVPGGHCLVDDNPAACEAAVHDVARQIGLGLVG